MRSLGPVTHRDQLHVAVSTLIGRSRVSRRDLSQRAGLSKDQLSRTLRGARSLSSAEALALLHAAELPARGAMTLVLYDRADIVCDWTSSGLAAFLEALVAALPDALNETVGFMSDRVDPRWGKLAARLVAERIARHIAQLVEREERFWENSAS